METKELKTAFNVDRYVAGGLAVACFAILIVIAHHPVARAATMPEKIASIARQGPLDRMVHGSAMLLWTSLGVCMTYYSLRRGIERLPVLAGCLSYGLATIFGLIAMTFDGFVLPEVVGICATDARACAHLIEPMLRFSGIAVQVFTWLGLVLMSSATMLWSLSLMAEQGRAKIAALLGFAVMTVQFWMLNGVAAHLTPHSLLMVLVAQLIWYLAVAASLAGLLGADGSMQNSSTGN